MDVTGGFYGKPQDRRNWALAVELSNTWRKMLGVSSVNYPYPGSFEPVKHKDA
jgi:hypothetical protein